MFMICGDRNAVGNAILFNLIPSQKGLLGSTSSDSILDDADEEELGRYLEQLEKCERRLVLRDDSPGVGDESQVPPKGDQ